MSETVNGKIKATRLTIEDHDCLCFWLHLEWLGGGQGLGGFALDGYDKETKERSIGFGPGLIAIRRILETVGVMRWEDLPGKLLRIKHYGWGWDKPPIIGHIIEDKWFDLGKFMAENQPKSPQPAP